MTHQPYAALVCCLMVSTPVIHVTTWNRPTTHRSGRDGRLSWPGSLTHQTLPWSTLDLWVTFDHFVGKVRQVKTDVLTTEPRRQPRLTSQSRWPYQWRRTVLRWLQPSLSSEPRWCPPAPEVASSVPRWFSAAASRRLRRRLAEVLVGRSASVDAVVATSRAADTKLLQSSK